MPAPSQSPSTRVASLSRLAAVVAVTSWGIAPVVVADTNLDGMAVAFYRLDLGAVLMVAILYSTGRRLSWRLLVGAIPGGIAFGLDILLFFTALKLTTVADATIISALQPALVFLVVGPMFGEQVRRGRSCSPRWPSSGSASSSSRPAAWPAAAFPATCWRRWPSVRSAWYFVAVKQARRRFAALEYQTALAVVAAVLGSPVVLVSGQNLAVPNGHTWALLALTIAMGTGAHFLMNWAHAFTPLKLTSLLTLASPAISVAAAAVVLGEQVLAAQVVGIVIVLGSLGIVVARMTASDRRAKALDGLEDLV